MKKLLIIAIALTALCVRAQEIHRHVVRGAGTNTVVYFGAASTNYPGYSADSWTFLQPAANLLRLHDVAVVFPSNVTLTVSYKVTKNGVAYTAATNAVTSRESLWAPPAGGVHLLRGDRLTIDKSAFATNDVVIDFAIPLR